MTQEEIDKLLGSGGASDSFAAPPEKKVDIQSAAFEDFSRPPQVYDKKDHKIDMLLDLSLPVAIELGKTTMMVKDILELERGYVIELDKMASEPVDVFVNNKKIAEGEVVVIDKHFGIRITSLVDPANRIKEIY
jgi:flagellar motor switch protein FliN